MRIATSFRNGSNFQGRGGRRNAEHMLALRLNRASRAMGQLLESSQKSSLNGHISLNHPHRMQVIGVCYYLSPKEFELCVDSFISNLRLENVSVNKILLTIGPNQQSDVKPWMLCRGNLLDTSAYATAAIAAPSADLYLFLNDTLFLRHPWRTMAHRFADLRGALVSASKPAAVGEVHSSTDLLMLDFENPTRSHLSTFCFILNRQAFQIFKGIAQTLPDGTSTDSIISWLNGFITDNSAINNLLYVHLTVSGTPWSWKGLKKSPPDDLVLRKKATVLFEYLLTSRILQSGGFVMPVNIGAVYRLRAKVCAIIVRLRAL